MSLADLARLNQNLIRSAVTFQTDELDFGPSNTGPETTDETEKPPEFSRFATVDRLEFERVVEWIQTQIFAGETTGMDTLIDAFVNDWGARWREDRGLSPTDAELDGTFAVPSLNDLIGSQEFLNGAVWLPLTATNGLPPVFESIAENEEGEEVAVVAVADPLTGVQFIEEEQLPSRPALMFEMARRGSDAAVRAVKRAFGGSFEADVDAATAGGGGGRRTATAAEALERKRLAEGRPGKITGINWANFVRQMAPAPGVADRPLPIISQEDLISALTGARGKGPSRPSGGGGVRRDIEFDRAELIGQVSDLWGKWYLESADQKRVANIVDSYIREARAFWTGKGGQLDFDTFVRTKLRAQPKYQTFYRNKPPEMSEEQHVARFHQPISQLGLRPETTTVEATAAITSGGSPTEQLRRVSRTREAQLQPGFSRRLADTIAGLGVR